MYTCETTLEAHQELIAHTVVVCVVCVTVADSDVCGLSAEDS